MPTKRSSGAMTTRRVSRAPTRRVGGGGKKGSATPYIVGGVVVVAAVAGLLLWTRKASAATPGTPAAPGAPVPTPTTPLGVQAAAMKADLMANGYKQSSQANVYVPFQTAAGLDADGFPGATTMTALANAMASYGDNGYPFTDGYTGQPIIAYPWLTTCAAGSGDACYNGSDAPTLAEWSR